VGLREAEVRGEDILALDVGLPVRRDAIGGAIVVMPVAGG
jgi:hypothetical protein